MMPDDLLDKNSHSFYLSNEAMQMAQELAELQGLSGPSAVVEQAIRAMYSARSAHTYQVAYDQAREDVLREMKQGE